ncbi:TPA: alanine--tRNA ligase [Candidatus Dojkabacteria bacterium]|uniref:alanine--tRNA ligase n=1 Tax=Candidatus Dojkabacteria bacterium TaxID=2099670 RepID=A0A832QCK9_9BACT|nr:alanine--tRNA ligase [Candidatus Dojkabacteria bacterium]
MSEFSYKKIYQEYLEFFKEKGHSIIPSAPLVPENDPSVLFVNAGMFPLIPFLQGEEHPQGDKLANIQRCIRTGDIEEIGDEYHCTAFIMLGNWSLNSYFKKEAINYTVEFFVERLGLDINNIYASVFEGDEDAPQDTVSIEVWKEIFLKYNIDAKVGEDERIQPFGKKENWWGLESGGPCGPDSEIFYDTGKEKCSEKCNVSCNCGKYVEIGNNVFMEYLKKEDNIQPLGRHNVDFGGGLERLAALLQNVDSVYEIDIYKPILSKVQALRKQANLKSERIIVDHIKAATWIIMDGVLPGRSQQGYILRRLIRRSVRHARKLGIEQEFTREVADICITQFKDIWDKLEEKREYILNTIEEEERKFNRTLEQGLRELEKRTNKKEKINGRDAFILYETYGLPLEVTEEILEEKDVKLEERDLFFQAEKEHQEKSRTAAKGMFKGGLTDTSEMSTKYHTANHLLLAALRKVLGEHVYQKGSNITPERLRFDFPNETKLTPEQVKEVEDLVNEQIEKKLDVTFEEVDKGEALKLVPFAAFTEKYGEKVKLYYIGPKENPFSIEICNGPHVENIGDLGKFKISKQENVGAGVKRIKAILE